MRTPHKLTVFTLALCLGIPASGPAQAQGELLENTKHNLSVSGSGAFKAQQESRMCIFCHAPHRARASAPLWNRGDSTQSYLEYNSTTFEGITSQPSGSSKLCLSCHDGSIALGMVVSVAQEIEMAPGHRTLSTGSSFIGTNLRDDHPVSFSYSTSRAGGGIDYLSEQEIVSPVHLDGQGLVQCTSCHDPHTDPFGAFLLATDRYSELCLACHMPRNWSSASHSTSSATWNGAGLDPWGTANYSSVAENACANCHRSHNAGEPQRLLNYSMEEDNCLRCHNGNVSAVDILNDLNKPYGHNPYVTQGVHDAAENPALMSRHAECQDCHNAHEATSGRVAPPGVPGALRGAKGMDANGQVVTSISSGYELCYGCHASNQGGIAHVPRQIQQMNVRLEFNPTNPSFHPVGTPGANSDVPSLLPPWTTASVMSCGDCHQSESSPDFGGSGASGPHGSIYAPLLGANYSTTDYTQESASAYALCYRCHNRSSILGDETFDEHKKHIVDEQTPCSACHDSHGISASQGGFGDNTHLINFDTSIVFGLPQSGELFFQDNGFRRGTCTLRCHGEDHDDERY